MSAILNIVRIVAIVAAIVAAFVAIPHVGALLLVLGLIGGTDLPQDRRVPVMLMALVLNGLNDVFTNIPTVGGYLADITGNIGIAIAGVAFTGISMAIFERLTNKTE